MTEARGAGCVFSATDMPEGASDIWSGGGGSGAPLGGGGGDWGSDERAQGCGNDPSAACASFVTGAGNGTAQGGGGGSAPG